ncbi:MAG: leucine-rich repeat domain-containing protein [Lachnospiraceae bacterium]|nr:leucine-rich repeat domain-containing protein [Lachnospiraceae bacterium]
MNSQKEYEIIATCHDDNFSTLIDKGLCGDNVNWELYADRGLYIYGKGNMSNFVGIYLHDVPWEPYYNEIQYVVIENGVSGIGTTAFAGCYNLQKVLVADSVLSIGSSAFYGCVSLQNVVLHEGIKSIGEFAFYECKSLHDFVIPSTVTEIGNFAFHKCLNLECIEIGENVTSLGASAFHECYGMRSAVIGGGVTNISGSLFGDCYSLMTVVLPDSIVSIEERAFNECMNLKSVYYYGTAQQWNEIEIEDENAYLVDSKIYFDSTYEIHDESIFNIYRRESNQTPVMYSGSCGENVKYELHDDGGLYIYGKGLMTDYQIFEDTPWNDEKSSIKYVDIESGVTNVGTYSFVDCKALQVVKISGSVTRIGKNAFRGCRALQSVDMNEGVTNIESFAFGGCSSIKTVVIPDSVVNIGSNAFEVCQSLRSVKIGSGVVSIGVSAFCFCTDLQSVIVGENVADIEVCAFYSCPKLLNVYYNKAENNWNTINFGDNNGYITEANIHFDTSSDFEIPAFEGTLSVATASFEKSDNESIMTGDSAAVAIGVSSASVFYANDIVSAAVVMCIVVAIIAVICAVALIIRKNKNK